MKDDKVIDIILADLQEIKKDVKELILFRGTLIGACAVVSMVISVIVSIIL